MFAFEVECIAFYAVTLAVLIARTASRVMLRGSFKKLQVDDYLIFFAMVCHTITLVALLWAYRINSKYLDIWSIDIFDPVAVGNLSNEEYENLVLGFKLAMVAEHAQILTLWTVKACLLIQYARLTYLLNKALPAKIVGAFCVVGFVVMEILFFAVWCTPLPQYWQVPVENVQCLTYYNHMITNAAFNLSSDLLILIIPFPILWHLPKLPILKKIGLAIIFALGLFTIVSGALSKYYTLSFAGSVDWFFWYTRESSASLIVASLPQTWTLIQRIFPSCSGSGSAPQTPKLTGLSSDASRGSGSTGNAMYLTPWHGNQDQVNSASLSNPVYEKREVHVGSEPAGSSPNESQPFSGSKGV